MAELSSLGPHYPSLPFTLWLGPCTLFCSLSLCHPPLRHLLLTPQTFAPALPTAWKRGCLSLHSVLHLNVISSKGLSLNTRQERPRLTAVILCTTLLTDQNDLSVGLLTLILSRNPWAKSVFVGPVS